MFVPRSFILVCVAAVCLAGACLAQAQAVTLTSGKSATFTDHALARRDNAKFRFKADPAIVELSNPACPAESRIRVVTSQAAYAPVPLDCARWEEHGTEYRYQGKKPELDSNGARKVRYRSGRLDIVLKGDEYSPNAISGPADWVETTFAIDGLEYCGRWEDIRKNEPDKIKAKGPTVPCEVTGQCADGVRNGDESDVDCGGNCQPCSLGGRCNQTSDCTVTSGHYCDDGSCLGHGYGAVCDPSNSPTPGGTTWMDSYAVDGRCWCDTTFDHDLGSIIVNTPAGPRTVLDICTQLDAFAPPRQSGDPIFNDAQCGNGPANNAGDEDPDQCPGRVDQGSGGCCTIGPTWNLSLIQ